MLQKLLSPLVPALASASLPWSRQSITPLPEAESYRKKSFSSRLPFRDCLRLKCWVFLAGLCMTAGRSFCEARGLAHRLRLSLWDPKMLCRTSGLRHLYLDSAASEMDSLYKLLRMYFHLLLTTRARAECNPGYASRRSALLHFFKFSGITFVGTSRQHEPIARQDCRVHEIWFESSYSSLFEGQDAAAKIFRFRESRVGSTAASRSAY